MERPRAVAAPAARRRAIAAPVERRRAVAAPVERHRAVAAPVERRRAAVPAAARRKAAVPAAERRKAAAVAAVRRPSHARFTCSWLHRARRHKSPRWRPSDGGTARRARRQATVSTTRRMPFRPQRARSRLSSRPSLTSPKPESTRAPKTRTTRLGRGGEPSEILWAQPRSEWTATRTRAETRSDSHANAAFSARISFGFTS